MPPAPPRGSALQASLLPLRGKAISHSTPTKKLGIYAFKYLNDNFPHPFLVPYWESPSTPLPSPPLPSPCLSPSGYCRTYVELKLHKCYLRQMKAYHWENIMALMVVSVQPLLSLIHTVCTICPVFWKRL